MDKFTATYNLILEAVEKLDPKKVPQLLKAAGFKQVEYEATAGAKKWWMEHTGIGDVLKEAKKALAKAGYKVKLFDANKKSIGEESLLGDGFAVERGGPKSILVAVYRKGQAGKEFEAGLDV